MWQENVDMVAGDFAGASWRRKSGPEHQLDSTIEETFKSRKLPVPPLHHGFMKLPKSQTGWSIRKHGAFEIIHEMLGLEPRQRSFGRPSK